MTTHTFMSGQHIAAIANYYGFLDETPIVQNPENQALLEDRGGVENLRDGDVLDIPDGQRGEERVGTGKETTFKAKSTTRLVEFRLYTSFRHLPRDAKGNVVTKDVGDKSKAPSTWGGPAVEGATVEIDGGSSKTTGNRGMVQLPALPDGTTTVKIVPAPHQTSSGPATADPEGDHGLGHWVFDPGSGGFDAKDGPTIPRPSDYQIEFRPLTIDVTVADGVIVSAEITDDKRDDRPHHAVLFWRGLSDGPDGDVVQVLEIDYKPDFLRRVVLTKMLHDSGEKKDGKFLGLSPVSRKRNLVPTKRNIPLEQTKHGIELLVCHQTGGNKIGSALNTFLANFSANPLPAGATEAQKKAKEKLKSTSRSGAQFVVDTDGHVVRMADDRYHTVHGGGGAKGRPPCWDGFENINDRAIGFEIVHKKGSSKDGDDDGDTSTNPFTDPQYAAVIGLIRDFREAYEIPLHHVIGHNDAVIKPRCPGAFFDWQKLEDAGVTLKPQTLAEADIDAMYGGVFSGAGGRKRVFKDDDRCEEAEDGTFRVLRGKKVLAEGLDANPFERLTTSLHALGYDPFRASTGDEKLDAEKEKTRFGAGLGAALAQFIRHYCTCGRYVKRQAGVYKSTAKPQLDVHVATVLEGARRAFDALP